MATWPVTLPQLPLADGYEEVFGDAFIRTQMEVGPAKQRRAISNPARPMVFPILVTTAQMATLETFYYTTLGGGSLPFDISHPRTSATVSMRFVEPPKVVPRGLRYEVSMMLEVMP